MVDSINGPSRPYTVHISVPLPRHFPIKTTPELDTKFFCPSNNLSKNLRHSGANWSRLLPRSDTWPLHCYSLLIEHDSGWLAAVTLGVKYNPGVMMLASIGLLPHVEPSNEPGQVSRIAPQTSVPSPRNFPTKSTPELEPRFVRPTKIRFQSTDFGSPKRQFISMACEFRTKIRQS